MKKFDWDSVFPLPKHKGLTVRQIYETDPYYLAWVHLNVSDFCFTDEIVLELVEKRLISQEEILSIFNEATCSDSLHKEIVYLENRLNFLLLQKKKRENL